MANARTTDIPKDGSKNITIVIYPQGPGPIVSQMHTGIWIMLIAECHHVFTDVKYQSICNGF